MGEYAVRNVLSLQREAPALSVERMLSVDGAPYPPGMYGRSFKTISRLEDAVGWETLKPLALARDARGEPSHEVWMAALSEPDRAVALAVLS